jgi:hypothetical protein
MTLHDVEEKGGALMRLSPTLAKPPESSSSPQEARRWYALTAASHREEAQEQIRREIRAGAIRVRPRPGDPFRVQVVPT